MQISLEVQRIKGHLELLEPADTATSGASSCVYAQTETHLQIVCIP